MSYVRTLRKIAHIRSYYGIEREFDRYYKKLKFQLRAGGQKIDHIQELDNELLDIAAKKTFDRTKAWDNPTPELPLNIAHKYNHPGSIWIENLQNQETILTAPLTLSGVGNL